METEVSPESLPSGPALTPTPQAHRWQKNGGDPKTWLPALLQTS